MAKVIVKNKHILNYALKLNLRVIRDNNHYFVEGHFRQIQIISLLNEIDDHLKTKKKVLIALDGDSAAGKTTLANVIKDIFDLNVIHLDDFIKVGKPVRQISKAEIATNYDFTRFNENVVQRYLSKQDLTYAPLNFITHKHEAAIMLPYKPSMVVEGAFVLHPQIEALPFDFKVILKVSKRNQVARIRERNGASALKMFKNFWIFNERQYQQLFEIDKSATHIIWT